MTKTQYQPAVAALQDAHSICIVTHLRPDADAIGSAAALLLALRQRSKEVCAVVGQDREISHNLYTIPAAEEVKTSRDLPEGYDLYVTVDCGSLDRTGFFAAKIEQLARQGRVLCIDHHSSNPGFGAINVVDTECESTTVVLLSILDSLEIQIDRNIAHCLYAGLMTDTGSFRWGRPAMHDIATRLMHYDLDTKQIAADLLDSTTADDLQMIGRVLAGLRIVEAGQHRLGILVARREDIHGHSDSAVESLVEFVRALESTTIGVVFKEQALEVWAVSLRSSRIDCSSVALTFGGGGHIPAAGYTAHASPDLIIGEWVAAVL